MPLKVKGPGFCATMRVMPGPIGDGTPYVNAMSVLKSSESKLRLSIAQERRLRVAARPALWKEFAGASGFAPSILAPQASRLTGNSGKINPCRAPRSARMLLSKRYNRAPSCQFNRGRLIRKIHIDLIVLGQWA